MQGAVLATKATKLIIYDDSPGKYANESSVDSFFSSSLTVSAVPNY